MSEINQFGSAKPARGGEGTTCAQCEAMLPDWMDNAENGELTAKDRAAFELHIATCAECGQMLAEAQRGAALLEMLKYPRPEPSSALLHRILASTSGVSESGKARLVGVLASPVAEGGAVELRSIGPAGQPENFLLNRDSVRAGSAPLGNVLPFRSPGAGRYSLRAMTHTMMQPRLAMTAAMAFFSIALTLNLTGVRLTELSLSDLKPSSLRRTFYQADASVVRYYDNLRVVYELESRVQEMKRSSDSPESDGKAAGTKTDSDTGAPAGDTKGKSRQDQQHKNAPKAGSGTSQQHSLQQNFRLAAAEHDPPRKDSLEPILLERIFEGNTAVNTQSKKEEQEGVLA